MRNRSYLIIFIKVISVLLLLFIAENQHIISKLPKLFSLYGFAGGITFIFIWTASILGLLFASFSPNLYIRSFFTVLISLATVLGVSFNLISRSPLNFDNLYILFDNTGYADEVIIQYPGAVISALLYASLSLTFLIRPPQFFKKTPFLKYAYSVLPVLPLLLIFSILMIRGGYGTGRTPMPYRIPALSLFIGIENLTSEETVRETVNIKAHRAGEPLNVVIIVDESMRGDYYDINNDTLNLTPYLSSQKDRLYNFGLASAGANCSTESNIILRLGVNQHHLEQSFKHNPYTWQFARAAGYRTVMIEGQAKKGKLNNRMTPEELRYIDDFIYPEGETSYEKDLNIARTISKLTSQNNSKPLFIYAVKAGLHFPFIKEVPQGKAKFKIDYPHDNIGLKNNMLNSYKNGIAYLIDPFFKALLQDNAYKSSILLYTSDHGQNLLDNGSMQTHCSSVNTSAYEGLVPLFAITGHEGYRSKFQEASLKNSDKASHFNIIPTVLSVLGYQDKDIKRKFGPTLFDNLTEPRKFMTGVLREKNIGIGPRNTLKWRLLPHNLKRMKQPKQVVLPALSALSTEKKANH